MTLDELESSDYGRDPGPHGLLWACIFGMCVGCDIAIAWGLVAWCKLLWKLWTV
jgi:hypothetical protein